MTVTVLELPGPGIYSVIEWRKGCLSAGRVSWVGWWAGSRNVGGASVAVGVACGWAHFPGGWGPGEAGRPGQSVCDCGQEERQREEEELRGGRKKKVGRRRLCPWVTRQVVRVPGVAWHFWLFLNWGGRVRERWRPGIWDV